MPEKMPNNRETGAKGEAIAAKFLKKHGYKIIEQNFRIRGGEIDIIASDKKYIVFAEVKTRKNANFAEAREFVTISKQRKIISTASIWLMKNQTELQPRFDVIEVYSPQGIFNKVKINHIENAFSEV